MITRYSEWPCAGEEEDIEVWYSRGAQGVLQLRRNMSVIAGVKRRATSVRTGAKRRATSIRASAQRRAMSPTGIRRC